MSGPKILEDARTLIVMSSRVEGVSIALVLALASVATSSLSAQDTPATSHARDREARVEEIRQIITHESSLTGPELVATIRAALQDPYSGLREMALAAIASRAAGPRIVSSETVRRERAADHPHIQSLRADVVRALNGDPEPQVREQAVSALALLDYRPDVPLVTIAPENERTLISHFYAESEARVRATIVAGFASDRQAKSAAVVKLVTDAFRDPSKSVRHAAAAAFDKLEPATAMALLVDQLNDADTGIRLQASIQWAKFGPQAAKYRLELQNARARETDQRTREFLGRALTAIGPPK